MGCTCSSERVAAHKPRGMQFTILLEAESLLRPELADDLCFRCREIVLPEPGTQWSQDFGESDITLASFGTRCLLCKLVRMQLWLGVERGAVNRGLAIDLSTLQDEPGKLYCRMRRGINEPVMKTASLSVSYFPPGQ
jgi:hypothetical protein